MDRTLLSTERVKGKVAEWKGRFGWILPQIPVEHPQASRHGGKVYFAVEDVQEFAGVGAAVSFLTYVDPSGIGALGVRPDELSAGGAGSDVEEAAVGVGPHAAGARGRGRGVAVLAVGRGEGRDGAARPFRVESQEALEMMQQVLRTNISDAIQSIGELEDEWTEEETLECIVKSFQKAGHMPELLALPWAQAVAHFVEHAMRGYAAACCDRPWFFQLDLAEAIRAALWEILSASRSIPLPMYRELEITANESYEELMDAMLMDKALWEATAVTFRDEHICSKVFRCLHASHGAAVAEACDDTRPLGELQRVEVFIRRWMEESMCAAWQALQDCGNEQLEESSIAALFQQLVTPFGEDHPFSCVPFVLTKGIGRPPSNWPLIWQAASQLATSWAEWPETEAWGLQGQQGGTLAGARVRAC